MNIERLLLQEMGLPLCAEELFDSARCRGDELRGPTENSAHAHWGSLNLCRSFALLCWSGGLWCRRMLPEGDAHRPATLASDGFTDCSSGGHTARSGPDTFDSIQFHTELVARSRWLIVSTRVLAAAVRFRRDDTFLDGSGMGLRL